MKSRLCAAVALIGSAMTVLLSSGCSTTDTDSATPKTPPTERVYRTGSNIPVRDVPPLSKEERDKQAEAARRILTPQIGAGLPKTN